MKKFLLLSALALALLPGIAQAAWAPTGDVNVIVAYKAGSGTDTGARILASEAEKNIGKTLVIQNLPGGDGKIGWTQLSKAKPDGQTIGFINLPTFTSIINDPANPTTFTIEDIVPIANHLSETGVVAVKADSPYKTIGDLVQAAKTKRLSASTNGKKASNHTAAQLLAKSGGFEYKALPYGGTADQLLALRQGEADFTCAKVADVMPLIKGDKPELRILGVFAEERLPELPDVPTLKENGLYDKWYGSSRGIVAPKGTPPEIIDFYVEAFKKTMQDPANIAAHEKAGLSLDFKDNKQYADLIADQDKFAREVVKGLYPEGK